MDGKIRVAHFAHSGNHVCSQETITHKTAKLLVQRAVLGWKSGKVSSPILQRECPICWAAVSQALPEKVNGAALEHKLADGSIADVALLVGKTVQAAVEIRVTHAVDDLKANRLPIPFIELDGYEIINTPTVWKPIKDEFKPLTCDKCKSNYLRFRAKVKQVAKANKIQLPSTYYRHGLCLCWRCRREIVVFSWPRDGIHDKRTPKVRSIPRIIRYRISKTINDIYWANTCPYCRSIQGDYFLHDEPDGPFFGVNVYEDSSVAFKKDMMHIAKQAVEIGLL